MTKKRLIAIILIPIISFVILIGSGFAIYKWRYKQLYYREIELLCVDKNGDIVANQQLSVGGITNRLIAWIRYTDEEGMCTLKVQGPATIYFTISTGTEHYTAEKAVTKADIISGEVIIIQFNDYSVSIE